MTPAEYLAIRARVAATEDGGADIEWAKALGKPPSDPEDFALEAIYVICNSGMKQQVARGIFDRVKAALQAGKSASTQFGHVGKASAIDHIWRSRAPYYSKFMHLTTDEQRLEFCGNIKWIGDITKYHLAKNFGVQVAKPDVHLERIAKHYGETVQGLCERLSRESGDSVPLVDTVLWRASNLGFIKTRELAPARVA